MSGKFKSDGTSASTEAPSLIDRDVLVSMPGDAAARKSEATDEDRTGQYRASHYVQLMYRAAIKGDWAAAKRLLKSDPTLAVCRFRGGNGPLHIAVSFRQEYFAKKLIQWMEPQDLMFEDSRGSTACAYAVAYGMKGISQQMTDKNRQLLRRITYFSTAMLDNDHNLISEKLISSEDSYGLLQMAIASKMHDVALRVLEKDGSLATRTLREHKITPLHVLAQQEITDTATGKVAILLKTLFGISVKGWRGEGEMQAGQRSVAEKLLASFQELEESRALKILRIRPILHDSAKRGNRELILMLVEAYPDLLLDLDSEDRSVFDVAIKHREAEVFDLLLQLLSLEDYATFGDGTDTNGENFLHVTAYLGLRKNNIPTFQMQNELAWFKKVEAVLQPNAINEKNKDKKTPREVFTKQHEKLLAESKEWMKTTSDSSMLIATIILTVVYAAAFTVPGGTDEATGLPVLVRGVGLTLFFIFEALALFGATLCIITFWSITTSGFEEDQFLNILPCQLKLGFTSLFVSLIGAISAFVSAYHLMLVEERHWPLKSVLLLVYAMILVAIIGRFSELWLKMNLPKILPRLIVSTENIQENRSVRKNDKTGSIPGKGGLSW